MDIYRIPEKPSSYCSCTWDRKGKSTDNWDELIHLPSGKHTGNELENHHVIAG